MLLFFTETLGDIQLLYVPGRDPNTNEIKEDHSSFATKLHFALSSTEIDIMCSRHFGENIAGTGISGYLKDTAWRMDLTWSSLKNADKKGFFSYVANMDYSWMWWDKNFYGFLEYYFNELGKKQAGKAYSDPEISKRIKRGELFNLGQNYLSGQIKVEVHSLFNFTFTAINNLDDQSGIFQSRAVWDLAQNFQLACGANLYYGKDESEYGGFKIQSTDLTSKPPNSAFLWLTFYY
ncbi:hypothetical protein GMMP15_530009 [Candidatus Magnetomoraceae bacterium gMMP-15]